MIVKCPKCGAEWMGSNTGHCCACHQTFTGYTAFDAHRVGSHTRSERRCLTMEEAGLVDAGRAYPCWTVPAVDETEEDALL